MIDEEVDALACVGDITIVVGIDHMEGGESPDQAGLRDDMLIEHRLRRGRRPRRGVILDEFAVGIETGQIAAVVLIDTAQRPEGHDPPGQVLL